MSSSKSWQESENSFEALKLRRDRLTTHLQQIVRQRDPYLGSGGHLYVRQYIHTQLAQWGEVQIHSFMVRGQTYQNLSLDLLPIAPNHRSKPPILVGAHYDAVPGSPGADDNATGVAVLLELARSLNFNPAHRPVRLVAFDMEEYALAGSRAYAAELAQQGQKLRLMISLEMLGYTDRNPGSQHYPTGLKYFYPDRGDFIALIGNLFTIAEMIGLQRNIKKSGTPCEWLAAGLQGKIVPDTRRSDHAPFWDLGYRAIMVTDTANLRNPHYHQPGDRLETLDLDFLTGVCSGLTQGIRNLH
ncbi:peptidase M28 [Thalassoporum mexicanum PCC 7367]|uniref:M20/M25/M40 family metallo-hydrolase n=1 Tax=Thalassoporum mexicanum TaxID=3457544 RepID=UPI00029F935E|nr:M20/M25/M40 family metallo-hydrolase [Pseudanabaena sp. PCC 7367]AFY70535.1 peptidase M28 [Pseudanabaena sp. PCC 7367]